MGEARVTRSSRLAATRKAVVQRCYRMQDEACEQAIRLLLVKAAGVTGTSGDDAKKGSLKHEVRANASLPR